MAEFDLSTAKPITDQGFDLSTAQPVVEQRKTISGELGPLPLLKSALLGLATTGPAGLIANVGSNVMRQTGQALENVAYKAGGAVTDIASKALPPEPAAGLGFATNVGIQAIPMAIGGVAGKLASPAMQSGARQLMQSALKPSKRSLETGEAGRAIGTIFEQGVNVTPGGVRELRSVITKLNDDIKDAIARLPAMVDKQAVTKTLDNTYNKFMMQANPQSDIATIEKALTNFLEHPLLRNLDEIPVQLAQQLKQGTYKALGSKAYGELKGAEIEAQKALARGLKEEIARVVPGIDKLNKTESELLNAESLMVSRTLMDANKNPMGLGWLAAHPATWLGFAIDRSPLLKSLIARTMYSGSEQIPATAGRLAGGVIGSAMGTPNNR